MRITDNTPLLGKWKQKISRIDALSTVDCVPNAFAIVTGIAVAGFHVFFAVAGSECIDNTWDRLKQGRNPGPNQPGGSPTKHRRFRTVMTPLQPAIAPPPGQFGNTLFNIGDAAQRIGLFLGLVDGALSGIFYGATLARRYSGCETVGVPYAQMFMEMQVPLLLGAGQGWLGQWQLASKFVLITSPVSVGFPPGTSPFITVMHSMKQLFNGFPGLPDCSFSTEVRWYPSGDPVRQNYAGLGYTLDGSGVFFGKDILKHETDDELRIWCTKTYGVMLIERADFTVYSGNLAGGLTGHNCKQKAQTPE